MINDNIKIIEDYRKGKAREYFNDVFATIWDVPTGGFVESLLTGTPAFSIASNRLMRFQPEARDYINRLKEYGLLNDTADVMSDNVALSVDNMDWWDNKERKRAIDSFLNKFIHTDLNWKQEWNGFLNKLSMGEEI